MERMQALIQEIISSKKEISSDPLTSEYVKLFYTNCHSKDFKDYNQNELANLALSSHEFFLKKAEKEFKIRFQTFSDKKNKATSLYTVLDVVNDDMPFLLDSIVIQFDKLGIEIKNIIHPIFSTARSKNGVLKEIVQLGSGNNESVIQIHLNRVLDSEEIRNLEEGLNKILETVQIVVGDFQKILQVAKRAEVQVDNIKESHSDAKEVKDFISWIADNNFIFLGCTEFDIENKNGKYSLKEVSESKLGVFASKYKDLKPNIVNSSSAEIADSIKNPYLIEILKSRYKSQIHRHTNAERIRVQKFDKSGKVIGEYRFLGLFTSSVYYQSASLVPIIRRKIRRVVLESGFSKNSYSAKDLMSILESYPRDELFQIAHDDLFRIAMGIVAISGRSLIRFFARNDKFERFVSCLIFIPKDRFNTALRERVQSLLAKKYDGEITGSYTQITESNLIRLQLIIRTDKGIPKVDYNEIEQELIRITRSWRDDLSDAINEAFSSEEAKKLIKNYQDAFSISYTNRFDSRAAVLDIKEINKCLENNEIVCDLYKTSIVAPDVVELKIYSPEKELLLSNIMPVLDSFGFNIVHEHTYQVSLSKNKVWIHYFNLNLSKSGDKLTDEIKFNFEETIGKIWKEETKIGHLNNLVVAANLNWRQIYLLRAYTKYLYQAGFRFDQKYIANVFVKYRDVTKLLIELFDTKFNPEIGKNRAEKIAEISTQIKNALSKVSNAVDDSVIRRFFNIIEATIRTNFYQKNEQGSYKNYLSFKLVSEKIIDLPLPVPFREIFVYSTKVEGVHLRGGKVARGGLRWSDRHEDFRTEVLGLVKAQMTKNAVIVPVGSKGGFVVKRDTSAMNRDEIMENGIECYKTFLRGLLDLTDNIVNGKVVHPIDVVRHDETDPYLVVAADKGTATFSDIANSISAEYGFWLGDAFASGGSVGYDHKKMGITAKGGWISVKRHFAEMGIDIQNQDFTCIGIGDLAGDVFGNGMLLSKHIRLIAAFNHMHIFIDPNPDSATSFIERERMFNLPRSSWMDYDKKLISKGGGIYERSAKSIVLSKEAREALGIAKEELAPSELISQILQAPVDLLWNGGIGTYVKASDETHQDVGDRVNDALRVNGSQLRCKVVGEGGNLGFTQKGRIEYALSGGRINTDAMDNSAGVDCSDHEVNIKIALIAAMRAGKVTLEERNRILASMTDEVADLVLSDNRLQTQAITIAHSQGYLALGDQAQFLNRLEKTGFLNRKIEFLPESKDINKRQSEKIGLTRPELCVMLAYSKMDLYNHILNSDLVEDKFFENDLFKYFPKLLQKKFEEEIKAHQLRKEIIATELTNSIVNRAGITFISQISGDHGFNVVDIARNYVIVCNSFKLDEIWKEIEALDGKVPSESQARMFLNINKLLERSVLWLLRNSQKSDISSAVKKYSNIVNDLFKNLEKVLAEASRESFDRKVNNYCAAGVPDILARKIAAMDPLGSAYDIAEIAVKSGLDIKTVAKIYFEIGTRLNLKWLRTKISKINVDSYWEKLSSKSLLEDLYNYQMKIAGQVVEFSKKNKDETISFEKWIESMSFLVERYDGFISDLKSQLNPNLAMFVVALNRVKALLN